RMPAVLAQRTGSERSAGVAFFVARAGVLDGTAGLEVDSVGPRHDSIRDSRNQLAVGAVQDVKESILRRVKKHFFRNVVNHEVGENDLLGGVKVPHVGGSFLIMPDVHARVGLERDDGTSVKIVATTGTSRMLVPRSSIAGPD